jgi:hypothetical protein
LLLLLLQHCQCSKLQPSIQQHQQQQHCCACLVSATAAAACSEGLQSQPPPPLLLLLLLLLHQARHHCSQHVLRASWTAHARPHEAACDTLPWCCLPVEYNQLLLLLLLQRRRLSPNLLQLP